MALPAVHVPALSAAILPPKPSGQLFCYKLLVLLHDAQTGKAGHATSEQVAPNAHGHRIKTHLSCSQPGGRIFILIMGPPPTLNQPKGKNILHLQPYHLFGFCLDCYIETQNSLDRSKLRPSQTPTNHPSEFFGHITFSVPNIKL